ISSFSLSAPISRMGEARMEKLKKLIVEYSSKMSRSLGYNI
ncbi:MAG: IclR family transcriptional regulator, partial [Halanaerobium sp. MSAO_Bac5]